MAMMVSTRLVMFILSVSSVLSQNTPTISFISGPEVVAYIGGEVELVCQTENAIAYPVNWLKIRGDGDIMPISTGKTLILRSERFKIIHEHEDSPYTLKITGIEEIDAATYRCQVLTGINRQVTKEVSVKVRLPPMIRDNSTKNQKIKVDTANKTSHSIGKRQPYFDMSATRNVSSGVGQTSHLECTVRDKGNKTVIWIRKRDLTILTIGDLVYSSDDRFSIIHRSQSDDWTLRIRNTEMRDMGEYECEVNTNPSISMSIVLVVEDASTTTTMKPRTIRITSVTPNQIPESSSQTLNLVIENLPSLPAQFFCVFSRPEEPRGSWYQSMVWIYGTPSNATRTPTGLSCPTPVNQLLPLHQSHITATVTVLRLSLKPIIPTIPKTNVTFFRCSEFSSCTSCVSSPLPCDWCLDVNLCTHDTTKNCGNDFLITGAHKIISSIRSGPEFCPKINPLLPLLMGPEKLVSSGSQRGIRVEVDNIVQFSDQTRYICQFNIEGRGTSVNAKAEKLRTRGYENTTTIVCDAMEFSYSSRSPTSTARLTALWRGPKQAIRLDNFVDVTMYKCNEMAHNCGACTSLDNKYRCGWCKTYSYENKCSLQENCPDAVLDPMNWISYNSSNKCPTITSVTPHQLQRTTARTLDLVIENLPTLPGQFLCAFAVPLCRGVIRKGIGCPPSLGGQKTLTTNATRTATGVSCTTPRNDLFPLIPGGEFHFTSKLSVRMSDGPEFVDTNFTFFDCNTYSSCTSCVSSLFPCDWCVDGHRCTHDTAENCRNDILVTGINRIGPSIRSGPAFCPRLGVNATAGGSPEILVSSGLQKSIRVKVDHIAQFIIQSRFVCQFNIEGRVTSVNAQLLSDTIYCDDMEFSYTSSSPKITATFAVIWGGSKPLDNPDNIRVVIYRCSEMANNCEMCHKLNEKYECGWCQASKTCEVTAQCGLGQVGWVSRQQTCPRSRATTIG